MRFELEQKVYTYYLNNRSSERWTGTSVMQYKDIKHDTLDNLRAYDERRKHMHAPVIENAGWHFTNLLVTPDFVENKIKAYAHQEYNTPEFLSKVKQRIANNEDYLGRPFKLGVNEEDWPTYLKENRDKYQSLLYGS